MFIQSEDGSIEIIIVDPTSGEVLEKNCEDYIFNQINDNQKDICITNDIPFANVCIGIADDLEKSQ